MTGSRRPFDAEQDDGGFGCEQVYEFAWVEATKDLFVVLPPELRRERCACPTSDACGFVPPLLLLARLFIRGEVLSMVVSHAHIVQVLNQRFVICIAMLITTKAAARSNVYKVGYFVRSYGVKERFLCCSVDANR